MKQKHNHSSLRGTGGKLQSVRFVFSHPTARTVCLAGTFNAWSPENKPLHCLGGGQWIKDTILEPGTYEYCLVVDGQWMPDPQAAESVPNPYGGRNSVLHVAGPQDGAQPAEA